MYGLAYNPIISWAVVVICTLIIWSLHSAFINEFTFYHDIGLQYWTKLPDYIWIFHYVHCQWAHKMKLQYMNGGKGNIMSYSFIFFISCSCRQTTRCMSNGLFCHHNGCIIGWVLDQGLSISHSLNHIAVECSVFLY